MSMRRFILRVLNAFRHDDAEHEMTREVNSHLALLEDEHRRRGLTPAEARLAARRAMGSVTLVQDLHRDARSFVWLEDLRRDGRHALRRLRQAPGFAATAILTLRSSTPSACEGCPSRRPSACCLSGRATGRVAPATCHTPNSTPFDRLSGALLVSRHTRMRPSRLPMRDVQPTA
jgi:hypothetical protein